MAAVLTRLRAELRRRWPSWLGLAVVAGLGGGVVLGLLAGAERTDRAYPEFVEQMRAADVLVGGRSPFDFSGSVDLDNVEALPQVASTARATVSLLFIGRTGDGRRVAPVDVLPIIADDQKLGSQIERWKIADGRAADPEARRRGNRQLRPRRAARPSGRRHRAPALRPGVELRKDRGDPAERVRRAARRRPVGQRHQHRRARRRARGDVPHRGDRGIAARVPAPRARPLARAAPHPRVLEALRARARVQPVDVRAAEEPRSARCLFQGGGAACPGQARGLHREPSAPATEGRDLDHRTGHRAPARCAARVDRAVVRRRPGSLAPGVRGEP